MRLWNRGEDRDRAMESRLRASRPKASRDLVDAIAARTTARPRRRAALVFAVVLSSVLVASLAAFGGVSYGAQAVTSTVSSATSTLTSSYTGTHTTTTTTTPSHDQYGGQPGGCSPGYYKNHTGTSAWGAISTGASFNATFGVTPAQSGYADSVSL